MRILGISALFHDSAAALVVDGVVVAAAQEERFSRKKQDARLPVEAAAFCLAEAGLTADDLDYVVFYEKPLRKFDRILSSSLATWPRGLGRFVRAMGTWLGGRLWLEGQIARAFDVPEDRVLFSDHHLSHAASAFYPSPFERAAVLTVDGVGEWTTTAIHRAAPGPDGQVVLETLRTLQFPHSIGLLYSAITDYLGFEVNSGEYKVMGLAPFGEPRLLEAFERLVQVRDDASLELDMSYFQFDRSAKSYTPRLEALLGPARSPEAPLDPRDGGEGQRFADVARTLQVVTERYLLALAAEAARLTGETNLCLAGGVALNCVANGKLAREAPFDGVYVHPAAGDAGGALGAALLVAHTLGGDPRDRAPLSPFLGRGYAHDEVAGFLSDARVRHRVLPDDDALCREVAKRLAAGEIGGWFQGRFEWVPRALGARSILADARIPGIGDRVNARIKFRERFRPFAPAVLADEAERWFSLDGDVHAHLTPQMLAVVGLTDEGAATLPSVRHVDGSARVQTVDPAASPAFGRLLEAFRAETGVGVLLNTSFNLKGEPICGSPADALATFTRSGLDFLVLERAIVERAA